MNSFCSHNLTLGVIIVRKSPLIDIDEAGNRVIGMAGRPLDRLIAPSKGPR